MISCQISLVFFGGDILFSLVVKIWQLSQIYLIVYLVNLEIVAYNLFVMFIYKIWTDGV
jgi:hypothetical protein